MKENQFGCYLVAGVALAGALGLAVWLIGAGTLRNLAYILGGALGLALILGASALPIRAYRRKDNAPVVEHYYHDGTVTKETRILDGRAQPILLPGQAPAAGVYPEFMRAAWQAGLLANPHAEARALPGGQHDGQDLAEDAGELEDPDGWGGAIRPDR